MQCFLELLSGSMEAHFRRCEGKAQRFGDLLPGEPLELGQQQDRTVIVRQLFDEVSDTGTHLTTLNGFSEGRERTFVRNDGIRLCRWIEGKAPFATTKVIQRRVGGDAIEPRHLRVVVTHPVDMSHGSKPHLLQEILSFARVSKEMRCVTKNGCSMRFEP
jgi:hypothetical protein